MLRSELKELNSFKTRCWFNEIAKCQQTVSPYLLEKHLQPWKIIKKEYGDASSGSNIWAKYKAGETLPRTGLNKNGKAGPVQAARNIGDSFELFNHYLWIIVLRDGFQFKDLFSVLKNRSNFVKRYYYDLTLYTDERIYNSLLEYAGQPIHINEQDELLTSLDHLALQLMLLKMDCCIFSKEKMSSVVQNIALTLGPLSASHWFEPFYEEFFDWLEKHYWMDAFDKVYVSGDNTIKGWRKSQFQWIFHKHGF